MIFINGYVAVDLNGMCFFHIGKPERYKDVWVCDGPSHIIPVRDITEDIKDMTWTDEPRKVCIAIEHPKIVLDEG